MNSNSLEKNQFSDLNDFIKYLDSEYKEKVRSISLFDTDKTKTWSILQKQYFCKVFYHLRGHFHDFLWLMGNYAPNEAAKNIFLKNIGEEFGESRRSHEQLYINFATALNVDIPDEIIKEKHYTKFARSFNKGHIQWLLEHNWNEKLSAFAAYERLDNVDYPQLLKLANSFSLDDQALLFFEVHTKVEHYEAAEGLLNEIWATEPQSVKNGFTFIYNHQIIMWEHLLQAVEAVGQEQLSNIEEVGSLTT